MDKIKLLYIDLFCGAGGTSTGVEHAQLNGEKCAKVIACVNHDKNAILSHAANHPDTLHFTEDIRTLDLTELVSHTKKMKLKHPDPCMKCDLKKICERSDCEYPCDLFKKKDHLCHFKKMK